MESLHPAAQVTFQVPLGRRNVADEYVPAAVAVDA
ncbi:hypothetical protein QF050_002991 [Arthrobacter sp. SLBN-112]|nr:hypothetical protein [Arthrobacter sp. SLBN-112]